MKTRDDDLTLHNSSCSAAATKREIVREREIKREREGEGKERQPIEREREIGIISMMRFDSATFSFLAL